MAELSLQVAFATREGSRRIARKENTCTQIYHNLSKGTPRETCIAYQGRPTSPNQMVSSNTLLPEKQKKPQQKLYIIVNTELSVT